MNKMKPALTALLAVILVFIFARNMVNSARADSLFDGPGLFSEPSSKSESNSVWKSDGSLVIINNAKESGYVIKGDNDGNEIEYFVIPKDDGSPTFVYDDELIVCTNTGCY
jgi:hypothetical protein